MIADSTLDHVLALQFTVAWLGEGHGRRNWWRSGLVDQDGGLDFFERVAPCRPAWIALDAARRAATAVDGSLRRRSGVHRLRTLFHFDFEINERLEQRLIDLRAEGGDPFDRLALPFRPDTERETDAAVAFLSDQTATEPVYAPSPSGRELPGPPPAALDRAASVLAATLVPPADGYPMAHFRLP
jgi:hypothetical protein